MPYRIKSMKDIEHLSPKYQAQIAPHLAQPTAQPLRIETSIRRTIAGHWLVYGLFLIWGFVAGFIIGIGTHR